MSRKILQKSLSAALCISLMLYSCNSGIGKTEFGGRVTISGELKGIWISVFELDLSANEDEFILSFEQKVKTAQSLGFNAVFVHARSHGDAVYPSKLFPWSSYITGVQGKAISYDPLADMIKLSHNHNLQFHAWINPFRVLSENNPDKLSSDNTAKKWLNDPEKSSRIYRDKTGIYYNPSSKAVRELVIDGAKEILDNYEIDGLHMDDYFYPTANVDIDKAEYAAYTDSGGTLPLDDFRRSCINDMVKKLYKAVKSKDKSILFGISPQANMSSNRDNLFADVEKWCENDGYIDYIAPQIYFGFEYNVKQSEQPLSFCDCADYWCKAVKSPSVRLYIGLGLYRSGEEVQANEAAKYEWINNNDIIARQIKYSRRLKNYGGVIVFSYSSLTQNDTAKRESENMSAELKNKNDMSSGKIATVTAASAELMSDKTADDRSSPIYGTLPNGTVDYCAENEILNLANGQTLKRYRHINSGFRVYIDEKHEGGTLKISSGSLPDTNNVTLVGSKIENRHTVISFSLDWKAPFLIQALPQSYASLTGAAPDYSIESFECQYIDITFYYADNVAGEPDFAQNPLFSGYEWIRSTDSKLRLYLKNEGKFYGCGAKYNSSGELQLYFLNPPSVSYADNEYGYNLSGRVIMLDAGHGGEDSGAVGGGVFESVLNLKLTNMLCSELKKTGAEVLLTRQSEKSLSLYERTEQIRNAMPDIFISLHRNSSTNKAAKGFDSYYYYPQSKRLADVLFGSISGVFAQRSVSYYPFYVTRVTECPCVLIENGFISNDDERKNISDDNFNRKTAKALAHGVVNYFAKAK